MKNNNKKKKGGADIGKQIAKFLNKFSLEAWYFTVVFFCVVLLISLVVWRDSFYVTTPSDKVLNEFDSTKENFEQMKLEATEAVEVLKGRISRYETVVDFGETRDLFMMTDEDGEEVKNQIQPVEEKEQVEETIQEASSPEGGAADDGSPGIVQ